jgi:hypothetical protein
MLFTVDEVYSNAMNYSQKQPGSFHCNFVILTIAGPLPRQNFSLLDIKIDEYKLYCDISIYDNMTT